MFVQFRLRSVIINYNYLVYNSVNKLLSVDFFPIRIQGGVGGGGGSSFFKNANVRMDGGPSSAIMYEEGGGESEKEQFYANVIIEWPLRCSVKF